MKFARDSCSDAFCNDGDFMIGTPRKFSFIPSWAYQLRYIPTLVLWCIILISYALLPIAKKIKTYSKSRVQQKPKPHDAMHTELITIWTISRKIMMGYMKRGMLVFLFIFVFEQNFRLRLFGIAQGCLFEKREWITVANSQPKEDELEFNRISLIVSGQRVGVMHMDSRG